MSDALVSEEEMDEVDQSDEYEVVEDELEDEVESSDTEDPEGTEAPNVSAEEGQAVEDAPEVQADEVQADAEPDAEPDGEEEVDESRGPGPGADLSDEQIAERIYALLFASPEPLSVAKLVGLLERPPAARVRAALETIGKQLDSGPLPYQLRGIKGGYTLMTVPEMGEIVGRLAKGTAVERISPAALETLAIVAYRQPVTKAEIEAIRGVQAGPILRSLVDRSLVRVTGRADVPGHPLQYGTTKDFLDRFGLMGLGDLPRDAELAKD